MHRITLVLSFVLFVAACAAPSVEVAPQYGVERVRGRFGVSSGSSSAQSSLDDLGLGGREGALGARADLRWGSPHLSVSYTAASFSGDGTATTEFSQGGTTISAGEHVASDLDVGVGSAALTFDLVPGETVEAGIGIDLTTVDFRGSVESTSNGERIATNELLPIPALAARAAVHLGRVEASVLLSGSRLDLRGDTLDFYDIDLRAQISVFAHGALALGWRRVDVRVDYKDGSDRVKADVALDGPYIALVFGF